MTEDSPTKFKAVGTSIDRGPGYVCKCIRGSPKPHHVILVASLHDEDCPVRKKIVGRAA